MRSLRHRQYTSSGSRWTDDSLGLLGPAVAGPLDILSPPAPAPAASAAAAMMMMNAAAALPPSLPQPSLGMDASAVSAAQAPMPSVGFSEQMPIIPPAQLGNLPNHALLENQALLLSRPQSGMGTRTKIDHPLFSQLGLGVSRCSAFTTDATESAVLAVQDALGKIALPPIDCLGFCGDKKTRGGRRLLAQIKLGVPADGGTAPQRPMRVDHAAVMEQAAPYNIDAMPVQVVLGGLVVEDDAAGNHGVLGMSSGLCVAVASVTIVMAIVEEEPPQRRLGQERVGNPQQMEGQARTAIQPHRAPQGLTAQVDKRLESSTVPTKDSAKESALNRRKRPPETSEKPQVSRPSLSSDKSKRQKNVSQPAVTKGGQTDKKKEKESSASTKVKPKASLEDAGGDHAKNAKKDGSPKKPTIVRSPPKSSASDSSVSVNAVGSNNPFSIHSHPSYTDHAAELPTPAELAQFEDLSLSYKTPPFPMRLHRLLEEVSRCPDRSAIVGWLSHGRAFRVLDVDLFVKTILPEYFRLTKYCSFLRQLNLYGFRRIGTGPDRGSYYSEWFLRGRPVLTSRMRRVRVNGNGRRIASDPDTEPDFYSMPPVEELEGDGSGTVVPIAEAAGGTDSEKAATASSDGYSSEMTSSVHNPSGKLVGSIVSSEDAASEDDAGCGLLALRAGV